MKRVAQKQRRLSFFIVFNIFIRHRRLLFLYCILTLCQGKMSKSNRTSQSDKLDEIREQLILLNENFRETRTFFMEFLENWRQERNSTRDTVLNSLGRITSQVGELNSQMIDLPNVTLLNDTNAIWIKNEAFRIRRSMNKIWRNNLNQRKQAFWNMLKNENTSVIYVDWFSRDNAIIPKKFQSKTFPNEPEELKKIKEALSLEKMKAQAKLHHAVAVRNKAKFEEKDREMLKEIEKISSVHVRQQLQELWRNDCKKQEEKSQNLWEVKKSWFKKFEYNGENIANSEDAAPTTSTNQDQRRGKRRNGRQPSKRRRNNSRPRKNNQNFNNTSDRNRDTANSRNSGNRVSQQRRKKGQQRNPTQNNRQQRSRPQERNSNRNTENNRRARNNNRTSKDNDRSTGRSNYNRRPFLGQGRYSNPNQT